MIEEGQGETITIPADPAHTADTPQVCLSGIIFNYLDESNHSHNINNTEGEK